ncbi:MAG: GTP-binding protein [Candidatus Helarchaeota archaeon]|nr:GTP-binding protein [Candidatus Helarchaeota archaeon]
MQVKKKKVFKIVVLGEAGVGKTSLVRRYCEGSFLEGYKTTIGSDFYVKYLRSEEGSPLILSIWDLAGEHRFQFVMENFMKGAKGALLVFDLARKRTFIKLAEWLQILQKAAGSVPLILIGNKSDLIDSRFVSADEAKAYAENNGIAYFETSAKLNLRVDDIFQTITNLCLSKEASDAVEFKEESRQLDI